MCRCWTLGRVRCGDGPAFTALATATCTGIPDGTCTDAVSGDTRVVTDGRLTVAAPGKGNVRVYVLGGAGRIGTAGPYLKQPARIRRAGPAAHLPAPHHRFGPSPVRPLGPVRSCPAHPPTDPAPAAETEP